MGLKTSQFQALVMKNYKARLRAGKGMILEIGVPLFMWFFVYLSIEYYQSLETADIWYEPMELDADWEYWNYLIDVPILYVPACPALTEMFLVGKNATTLIPVLGFSSIAEGYKYSIDTRNSHPLIAFDELSSQSKQVPTNLKFKVVLDKNVNTEKVFGNAFHYSPSGALIAETFMTHIFINYWRIKQGLEPITFHLATQQMPIPKRNANPMRKGIIANTKSVFFFVFLAFVCFATRTLVEERELKLKESMTLMGLTEEIYWLAWTFVNTFWVCFLVTGTVVMLCVDLTGGGQMLHASSALIGFVSFLHIADLISFSLLVSYFIKKARHVTPTIIIVSSASLWISTFLDTTIKSLPARYIIGTVLFCVGYDSVMRKIIENEGRDMPSTFGNIYYRSKQEGSVLDGTIIILLNMSFNVIATWYVDQVFRDDVLTARPYYFLFTRSFWFPEDADLEIVIPDLPPQDPKYFERPGEDLVPGIQVQNLVKTFGDTIAVRGVNLDVYKDQITVLLGPNGAGKTTAVSIITGLIPPTSGTAFVNGFDIKKNIKQVRENIGLCPQHDVLFPKLNVREHLYFYTKLRGHYGDGSEQEINEMLYLLDLGTKRKAFPQQLSGGQKRKLSVACAFVGNSKIVFLDEPSTGMDPNARQQLWKFLEVMHPGRTLLLTTHYMDEADILGDRIAIMAKGVLQCYGTPWFLKNVYGTGYELTIMKAEDCNFNIVSTVVTHTLPDAVAIADLEDEIVFRIPEDKISPMSKLLKILESQKEELNIHSHYLKSTTLEDVFIKVCKEVDQVGEDHDSSDSSEKQEKFSKFERGTAITESSVDKMHSSVRAHDPDTKEYEEQFTFEKCTGIRLLQQQLRGIVYKKMTLYKRTWITSVMLLALPCLFVLYGSTIDEGSLVTRHQEPIYFTLDSFYVTLTVILVEPNVPESFLLAYTSQFEYPHEIVKVDYVTESRPGMFMMDFAMGQQKKTFDSKVFIGAYLTHPESNISVGLFKGSAVHSEAIATQFLLNAHVKYAIGENFSVQTGVHHLVTKDTISSDTTLTIIKLICAVLPAVFIHGLIGEKNTGAKHLQMLTDVHPITFWIGHFLFDMSVYLFIVITMMLALLYYPDVFLADGQWLVLSSVLVLFGLAILPFIYCIHWLFTSPTNGVNAVIIFNLVLGFALIEYQMESVEDSSLAYYTYYPSVFMSLVIPSYALYWSLEQFQTLEISRQLEDFPIDRNKGSEYSLGFSLVHLIVQCVLCWIILISIEQGWFRLLWYYFNCSANMKRKVVAESPVPDGDKTALSEKFNQGDSDVAKEQRRIEETSITDLCENNAVLFVKVSRSFGTGLFSQMQALKPTSLGVGRKQCFGMLGQNGAGKTTIFKMLTGHLSLTEGDIYLEGINIKWNLKKIQSKIGYCPQRNALNELLTGQETLHLYGRLRGIPEGKLKAIAKKVMTFVNLDPTDNIIIRKYSGGSRRKLSLGIAIVGNPRFLMLDEPTAGVDPISRRSLWELLQMIRRSGRTIFMTTQSMEECDALCTRVAILVRGQIVCLGSPNHLKHKYGQGYTIILYATIDENGVVTTLDHAIDFIKRTIDSAEVFNQMEAYVHIQIQDTHIPMSQLFGILQQAQDDHGFASYRVQQSTLEQVFLMLMKQNDRLRGRPTRSRINLL